ncbi:MAG: hypothetical protein JWP85_2126 [Rhodoglobus sp.]|nr:hypothetical protein [Rhodoglobus sp.]
MTDHVALHDLAQRLRDAAAPSLGSALDMVNEFLFVGEEGEAIALCLDHAGITLPANLVADLERWAASLPDHSGDLYLRQLGRVPA